MFKAIKDNKIIAMNDTGVFPCLVYDTIEQDDTHNASDYVQTDNEFVLTSDNRAIEQKQLRVRAIRNQYLSDTDKYMIADYPITDEQREEYKEYRKYLRDYTKTDSWYEKVPITFEEFEAIKEHASAKEVTEQIVTDEVNNGTI